MVSDGLLGQNGRRVGVPEVEDLLRQNPGEPRLENALDEELLHQPLVGDLGVQNVLDGRPGLGGVEAADLPHLLDVVGVEGRHHPLLVGGRGEQLLQAADADALLQGEDHDQEGDVDPVIPPLLRGGHHLQPDVVVDGGGGHRLVLLVLHGDEVQVLGQQGNDLVHVQADVRQLLPGGEFVMV